MFDSELSMSSDEESIQTGAHASPNNIFLFGVKLKQCNHSHITTLLLSLSVSSPFYYCSTFDFFYKYFCWYDETFVQHIFICTIYMYAFGKICTHTHTHMNIYNWIIYLLIVNFIILKDVGSIYKPKYINTFLLLIMMHFW